MTKLANARDFFLLLLLFARGEENCKRMSSLEAQGYKI